jgi:hypothetical protein
MAAAMWRSLPKSAAMGRSLANNLRAAARTMRTLAEMAALPGVVVVVVVVVVATSGEVGLLPSGRDASSRVWRALSRNWNFFFNALGAMDDHRVCVSHRSRKFNRALMHACTSAV